MKTQEETLKDFYLVHGDLYDYSLVEYKNNKTKVKIICSIHGVFEQQPNNHKSGQGCIECGLIKRVKTKTLSQDKVIKDFNEVHGDRYDYSLVKYTKSVNKVKIICKTHGVFEQSPNTHKSGSGCPKCRNVLPIEKHISDFRKVHGDKYDYSLVEYIHYNNKIKIICPVHGVFEQSPSSHKSSGCQKCYGNQKKTTQEVIKEFKEVHGDLYDYSLVEYKTDKTKVKIICKEHGVFDQEPRGHKIGQGCPKCKYIDTYRGKPTYLYYISISDGLKTQYKIGVCLKKKSKNIQVAINKRYSSDIKTLDIKILKSELFDDSENAYLMEQKIITANQNRVINYSDMMLESGYTETFHSDIIDYFTKSL